MIQLGYIFKSVDSQYKLLSELLSDQAAFITSPKTSLANYLEALPPCPPVSTGLLCSFLQNRETHIDSNMNVAIMKIPIKHSQDYKVACLPFLPKFFWLYFMDKN